MKRERNEEGGRIEILIGGGIGDDIDFDGKLVFFPAVVEMNGVGDD